MGKKGAKLTEAASEACECLKQDLSSIGDISSRKMFGGYGLFAGKAMFALVTSEGKIFFKVAKANQRCYEEAGAEKFGKMPYYALPDAVRKNPTMLDDWARASIKIAYEKRKS